MLLQYRKNKSDQNKIKSTKIMYVTESKRTKKNISLFGSDLGAIDHDVELDHVSTNSAAYAPPQRLESCISFTRHYISWR